MQLGSTLTSEDQLLQKKREHENATASGAGAVKPAECGSCYGAQTEDGQCCNTCDEVKEAYRKKGWALTADMDVVQCSKEDFVKTVSSQDGEGCRLSGYLEVAKVAGNFHFAPGHGFQHAHLHVHDLLAFTNEKFNVSHKVHELSFGDPFPGVVNPMNGAVRRTDAMGMFQYYAKVVPTAYTYRDGRVLDTNQFSVTEHFRSIHPASGRGLPGLWVHYDLSPIMVQLEESQKVRRTRPLATAPQVLCATSDVRCNLHTSFGLSLLVERGTHTLLFLPPNPRSFPFSPFPGFSRRFAPSSVASSPSWGWSTNLSTDLSNGSRCRMAPH